MTLQTEIPSLTELTPSTLERFANLIDPDWISQALHATGKASIRRRTLPAEQAIWLVIGLALFRNEPIWHIVQQLNLALPGTEPPSPTVSVQARQRLGDAPLAWLFQHLAQHWGCAEKANDLRILAVDGVVWSAPDTPENRLEFGGGASQYGAGSWPQVRGVCLMDTDTHLLLGADFGSFATGELSYADPLRQQAPDYSLTLFDRAYFSAAFLLRWQNEGTARHWLMRAKSLLRYEVIRTLADGDEWIRMQVSAQARKQHSDLPEYWEARLVTCTIKGKAHRFLTSLVDSVAYPAQRLAELYRQRWEIELGFREIKQGLLHGESVLRSKQPALVRQEIWGGLIAYNLLRQEMRAMAKTLAVPAQRISFQWAALAIVDLLRFSPLASAGTLPSRLRRLYEQAGQFLLPPRRDRHYPRVVKSRGQKYPKKCQSP